jgi:hypothetical protein
MKRFCSNRSSVNRSFEFTERELLRAYNRMLHRDYPNPERIGCPGREVLQKMAFSIQLVTNSMLEHLGQCAPCVDELKELRSRLKIQKKQLSD